MKSMIYETKLAHVNAAAVSAGTAVNTSSVDMLGWDGVMFFGTMASFHASNSVNLAQSADDSSFADLEGTSVSTPVDVNVFCVDLVRSGPGDRYVRLEVVRAGKNTALGDIFAIQYRGGNAKLPATWATTINKEFHASPAEGTA